VKDDAAVIQEPLRPSIDSMHGSEQVGVDVLGDDLARAAPALQEVAPCEGLHRDGVAWPSRREELMYRGHQGSLWKRPQ
jgi:hypothetical protein